VCIIKNQTRGVGLSRADITLATRMAAHGTLREFDSSKESIEDFKDRFEFYCLANNIKGEGEAQRRKGPIRHVVRPSHPFQTEALSESS